MRIFLRKHYALIIVLVTFFYFRFSNIYNRITFDWDQETLSFQLKEIIRNNDIILIGHRATDALGFYFGPYFEYLFVPFYVLSGLHPIGLSWFVIVWGIIFACIAIFVLNKLYSRTIALGFLFLWAVNPLFVTYDITIWAPILIPAGILLTWYALWRIYKKTTKKNFMILGLVAGFFTQIHSLYFPIIVFSMIFLAYLVISDKKYRNGIFAKSAVMTISFLLFMVPLVVFDIRHDFQNLNLIFFYFNRRAEGIPRVWDSIEVFGNFISPIIATNNPFIAILFYFVILALLIRLMRTRTGFYRIFYTTGLGLWIISALTFLRYTERPSEYYFMYLYPLILVSIIDFLQKWRKYAVLVLCAAVALVNTAALGKITQSDPKGLHVKEQTVFKMKELLNGKEYFLTYEMPLGLNTGYEYLLDYHGIAPSKDNKKPLVILRIPAKKGDVVAGEIGIHLPNELK